MSGLMFCNCQIIVEAYIGRKKISKNIYMSLVKVLGAFSFSVFRPGASLTGRLAYLGVAF